MGRDLRDSIDLSSVNVFTLFKRYFFPTLLGMLSISAVTAIDGIFVGHGVGSDGIAAINILIPVLMIFTGVGLMMGAGCSVVASIHLSQGKEKAARINVTQAMIFVTIFAVVLSSLILVLPDQTARLLGASDHLLPLVKEYMMWYVPSWTFQIWLSVSMFIIRLDGKPKLAMLCNIVPAALNVFLDWLFIFPLGRGLMGAAFATSISTVVGSLIALYYLLFGARRLRLYQLKTSRKSFQLTARNIGYQCRIGSSGLLGEATMAVMMFVGNRVFMHYLGDDGVGAFGIACYYLPFIFMAGNAIAQSSQPIISYNFGAGLDKRVNDTTRIAIATAVVCGAIVTATFALFPEFLVGLFVGSEGQAAQLAIHGLPLIAASFVCFILNLTVVGYYQSVERVKPATSFALLRGLVFLVSSFLLLPKLLGIDGIWLALPLSETATTAVIVIYYLRNRRRSQAQALRS